MPVTRSSVRQALKQVGQILYSSSSRTKLSKFETPTKQAKQEKNEVLPVFKDIPPRLKEPSFIPATLTFQFEDAREHLISADKRFADVFERLPCGPYEKLEAVDPFRSLVTSILGQQISWKAARSITHKFIRLYDPSLPEKLPETDDIAERSTRASFPTPSQVAATSTSILRGVGLSNRKAEYVIDLANRFVDDRLSAKKMMTASDEELAEMLIEVRGIGMWTVHMFSMFSMRRPDVLPIGDLGVQRGVARWFLSWHDPQTASSPVKLKNDAKRQERTRTKRPLIDELRDIGRGLGTANSDNDIRSPSNEEYKENPFLSDGKNDQNSSYESSEAIRRSKLMAAATAAGDLKNLTGLPSLPEPFTPSINRTLNMGAEGGANAPPKLPDGLSVSILQSRLEGKKVRGAILTPSEMEELTTCWKPYRSLGSYYMWALAEQT